MKQLSSFEENLVWMSYRYAIGRHTGAATGHAEDLMEYLPGKLDESRADFMADDIRHTIYDRLRFKYDGIANNRDYLHICVGILKNNNQTDMNVDDCIIWDELARILDSSCHITVKANDEEFECIETYQYNYNTHQYDKVYKTIEDLTHHKINRFIDPDKITGVIK